ncbi:unnamed protein product [Mytilus edulis]|uniref:Paired domain-containing protein n=1 Tax=Mytilus edulis TaxID=6550 RepID=A0A8S3RP14_MYTED|nr:unnamed protein product [Mytilus edulis]
MGRKGQELSTDVKNMIVEMFQNGFSRRKIADILRIPKSTVIDNVRKFLDTGSVENKPRSGRPLFVKPRDYRKLERIVKTSRRSSLCDITNKFNEENCVPVSKRTIQHHLHKHGYHRNPPYLGQYFPCLYSVLIQVDSEKDIKCNQAKRTLNKVLELADAVIWRKRKSDVYPVRTSEFQCKIEDICRQREDEWALEVRGRLAFVQDLHAADALYHQTCSVNFRTLKQTPLAFSPPAKKTKTQAGRKSSQSESFLFAAKYLQQNEDEQITVADLVKKMSEHCGIDDAYGVQHMKNKLQEHFGDKAAAKILKSEILSSETSNKALYPSPGELSAQNNMKYVPESLQTLLQTIFSGKDTRLKIMSIGQSIVQAAAPRMCMLPLQLALGVQLHHNFSSRFLIDTLNSLGFCSSYTEIQKFECCAAAEKGNDIPNFVAESFLQYVADNVDHNSGTLDGNNTFHGMGIMAAVTPGSFGTKPIPRIDVTSEQIALLAKINISYYKPLESNQMASCIYSNLRKMNYKDVDCSYMVNLLWKVSWPLRSPMPGWSGYMQMVQEGTYPGKSSFIFLPMIDLNPSDLSCIYSTLKFICKEAHRYQKPPVVTFDQPLYWKALCIVTNEKNRE